MGFNIDDGDRRIYNHCRTITKADLPSVETEIKAWNFKGEIRIFGCTRKGVSIPVALMWLPECKKEGLCLETQI